MTSRAIKYYSINEAKIMLPLIKSYCRSLQTVICNEQKRAKIEKIISNLISLNPKKQKQIKRLISKIKIQKEIIGVRYSDWIKELDELGCYICCPNRSKIDIPVWDDVTDTIKLLCIGKETKYNYLFWHNQNEDCTHVVPHWDNK